MFTLAEQHSINVSNIDWSFTWLGSLVDALKPYIHCRKFLAKPPAVSSNNYATPTCLGFLW
jgi:hypothetical protein